MRSILLSLILLALPLPGGLAQGSLTDYQRAQARDLALQDLSHRLDFAAHWQDDDHFWYRHQSAAGQTFRFVDAKKKSDEPAFDQIALAVALTKALQQAISAAALPITNLRHQRDWYFMTKSGRCFRWQDGSRKLTELTWEEADALQISLSADLPAQDLPAAPIPFVMMNRCSFPVEYFWLPSSGSPKSYGKIAAGEAIKIGTYSGHAWEFRGPENQFLGRCRARADAAIVVIDDQKRDRNQPTAENPWRSPDGRYQASIQDHNLSLEDLRTKKRHPVTTDGSADHPYSGPVHWSPDSERLLFRRVEKAEDHRIYFVESAPKDQLQPKLHNRNYLKPGDRIDHPRLFLLSCPKMKVTAVPDADYPEPWSLSRSHWQPDSAAVHVLYNQRGHQVLRLLRIDRSAEVKVLIEEKSPTFVDYAGKLSLHYLDDRKEILWASERAGSNQLYLFDAKTGKLIRQLTQAPAILRRVLEVSADEKEVLVEVLGLVPEEDPYQRHLQRIDLHNADSVTLTSGDGDHEAQFSPNGDYLIDRFERPDLPPQRVLRQAKTGAALVQLAAAELSDLKAQGVIVPERFVAPGRDGSTLIYGLIWRPSNFDPKASYPVIESIYAGPHDFHVPKNFRHRSGEQKLAELGFIVVKCDGMGTNWRSKAFHDVCWQNLGDSGFPDRIAWIKAAAKKYESMDLNRVGIYGVSAGGQSSLRALLAYGDFYHVAVSDCGCHDNRMDKIWWNELWMGWPLGPHYEEQSNVTQAHRLSGKLMLMLGELDDNVDPASTMQVVDALIKADRDFDLVIVPGAGHGTMGSAYGARRRDDFFVRHLLHREPRWQP